MQAAVSPSSEFARWWANGLQSSFRAYRNRHRFPKDFVFQISEDEWKNLRYRNWHLKFRPWRSPTPDADPEEKAIRANLKELKYVR